MILSSDIYGLIEFFSFLIWIFYGLNILCLIILKRRRSNAIGHASEPDTTKDESEKKDPHIEVSRLIIKLPI
jgi:hypothetical protein